MTEARIEVVSAPRCVLEPKEILRLSTKCLKHRSALLLSTGIPGWFKKVKYFSLFFRKVALIFARGAGSRARGSDNWLKVSWNLFLRYGDILFPRDCLIVLYSVEN